MSLEWLGKKNPTNNYTSGEEKHTHKWKNKYLVKRKFKTINHTNQKTLLLVSSNVCCKFETTATDRHWTERGVAWSSVHKGRRGEGTEISHCLREIETGPQVNFRSKHFNCYSLLHCGCFNVKMTNCRLNLWPLNKNGI